MREVTAASSIEWMAVMRIITETYVKGSIALLLNEPAKSDWGGEENDHFSANVTVGNRRRTAAFLLKGPARFQRDDAEDVRQERRPNLSANEGGSRHIRSPTCASHRTRCAGDGPIDGCDPWSFEEILHHGWSDNIQNPQGLRIVAQLPVIGIAAQYHFGPSGNLLDRCPRYSTQVCGGVFQQGTVRSRPDKGERRLAAGARSYFQICMRMASEVNEGEIGAGELGVSGGDVAVLLRRPASRSTTLCSR